MTFVPQECTLPTAQRPLRQAEFDDLFAKAVRATERQSATSLRLTLAGHEETVRDLTARESQCCSFFTFTITTPTPGAVVLDIEVRAGQIDVLNALQERAEARRA